MSSDEDSAHEAGSGYGGDAATHVSIETAALGEGAPQQHKQHTPVASVPLPPALPIEENRTTRLSSSTLASSAHVSSAHVAAAHATGGLHGPDEADAQPSIERDHWVQEPDFWEKETMIAMTGRYPVPRPKTRPLPPPQRFRPVARWKSMLLLSTLVVVTVLTCVGVLELGRLSAQVFGTQATPVVTHTAQPTVSPTKPAK